MNSVARACRDLLAHLLHTFSNALSSDCNVVSVVSCIRRGRGSRTYHEIMILHAAKRRMLAQLLRRHTRTTDAESDSRKKSRIISRRSCLEHLVERQRVPRRARSLHALDSLLLLTPRAVSAFLPAVRERIAEMCSERAGDTSFAGDEFHDRLHASQVLLLADFEVLVPAHISAKTPSRTSRCIDCPQAAQRVDVILTRRQ